VNRKADFFTKRIDSRNESNRFFCLVIILLFDYSNRELECSISGCISYCAFNWSRRHIHRHTIGGRRTSSNLRNPRYPDASVESAFNRLTVSSFQPSVLWRCWLGGRKGIRPVKNLEWWGAGVVICLERGADLYMAQLMPLPLTVSCFSKIQIGFAFLVRAHLGSPGKRAVKRV